MIQWKLLRLCVGEVYGLECSKNKICLPSKLVVRDTFQMSMASLTLQAATHPIEWSLSPIIALTCECHLLNVMVNVVVCKSSR